MASFRLTRMPFLWVVTLAAALSLPAQLLPAVGEGDKGGADRQGEIQMCTCDKSPWRCPGQSRSPGFELEMKIIQSGTLQLSRTFPISISCVIQPSTVSTKQITESNGKNHLTLTYDFDYHHIYLRTKSNAHPW